MSFIDVFEELNDEEKDYVLDNIEDWILESRKENTVRELIEYIQNSIIKEFAITKDPNKKYKYLLGCIEVLRTAADKIEKKFDDFEKTKYCEESNNESIKVFISQPMKNKTNDEILKEREDIKTVATNYIHFIYGKKSKIIFIDSFQKDKKGKPLYLLGESLKMLSEANIAFFPVNYEEYRGCNIEYKCAKEYGIRVTTYNKGIIE